MPNISLIARADNSGLGTLSSEFARHLRPKKVLIVDTLRKDHPLFPERYEDFEIKKVWKPLTPAEREWLLKDTDILLTIETPYDWSLIKDCRQKKVKSVLYTMFEMTPEKIPLMPDVLLCPSKLDYDVFKDKDAIVKYLPVPVATDRLIWQKRTKAEVFIHSASHGGMNGRKGTKLLLEAMRFVKSDIRLKIFSWFPIQNIDKRIEINLVNFKNYWQLWREGDVLIYPQDYNGICLPIIEAMASGLGVITTDIYPFNEYMPKELLVKPQEMYKTRAAARLIEVDAVKINPADIAQKIDQWANKDISKFSLYGKNWAKENSWDKLGKQYVQFFASLTRQSL